MTTTATEVGSTNVASKSETVLNSFWQRGLGKQSTESVALGENDADGVQEQLRSLIDNLANERGADRSNVSNDRLNSSLRSDASDKWFSDNHRHWPVDDGMLELAATSDKLTVDDPIQTLRDNANSHATYRTQLLASLELNREFELAGQATHTPEAYEKVLDPKVSVAKVAVAAQALLRSSAGAVEESSASSTAEGSIWQRSLLPLSFLAIGSLLVHRRNKVKRVSSLSIGEE